MTDFSQRSETLNAMQMLERIKTVDGAGSGLDADAVDGVDSSGLPLGQSIGGIPVAGQVFPRARPGGLGAVRFSLLR